MVFDGKIQQNGENEEARESRASDDTADSVAWFTLNEQIFTLSCEA